jgi:transposase InsO family protein
MICKVFNTSRAAWYRMQKDAPRNACQRRGPKPPVPDEVIEQEVKGVIWDPDYLDYGYRRVWAILRFDRNLVVGQKRIQRIMQRHEWQCKTPHHNAPRGQREGTVEKPMSNMMWGTDGTKFWTEEDGWCWLFPVIDHHDREIIGHRIAKDGTARAALDAVEMATINRFGRLEKNIIPDIELKLDHGCQNTAQLFMNDARWLGFELAYTFVGNPQGNAIAERVIGTLKRECIWHHRFKNLVEAERIITAFIVRYNTIRRHSSLGYRTPAQAYKDSLEMREVA